MTQRSLIGWTPYRAAWAGEDMIVDWCHHGPRRFVEPFYYETVVAAFTRPFNQLFQRRTLIEAAASLPSGLKPSGFIFHMSRCGSTLLSQALAADPVHIVVSEASPIRNVLHAPLFGPATTEQVETWLLYMANAFGQRRLAGEARFFIKFCAADIFHLPLIRRVFPDVPWVFLYRHPLEVFASQHAQTGADTMMGALPHQLSGIAPEELYDMSREAYLCRILAAFGQAALAAHRPGASLMLDYKDLIPAMRDRLPEHFGYALDAKASAALDEVLARHSKQRSAAFEDDGAVKRAAAAPFAELVDLVVGPTYAALQAASE
ncbi:sulfotransferase [Methylocystis heyeri]|uniref:Sulfotransferase family protein n=1 Tax=Methylocystis heyeri TaxID=391905 RepID=A0A6B8KFB5_9HYPH|nr:sulfotransferase [Methylocystis heyeri]QGM46349.1 sulfotransferase family protein [Methylocystis heyeri]